MPQDCTQSMLARFKSKEQQAGALPLLVNKGDPKLLQMSWRCWVGCLYSTGVGARLASCSTLLRAGGCTADRQPASLQPC